MTAQGFPRLGVLGGMGPLATVDFLRKIVLATPATTDQNHLATIVWNVPQIPDRLRAIAGTGPSPLPAMLEGIAWLNAAGAQRIAIPCNTAHLWFDELAAASAAPLIHIGAAALAAFRRTRRSGSIGLIATRATTASAMYQELFEAQGFPVVTLSDDDLEEVFEPGCAAIKSNRLAEGGALLEAAGRRLLARGAQTLLLACTEVPVALEHAKSELLPDCVDATQALAEACVDYWREARPHKS
jgi:aspartate racemase